MLKKEKTLFSQELLKEKREALAKREAIAVRNKLACLMVEMTRNDDIAKRIITEDQRIIDVRGATDKYLFDRELTFEDVVSFYYDNSNLDDNEIREINSNLTISELLLLLGSIGSIIESHIYRRDVIECLFSGAYGSEKVADMTSINELVASAGDEEIFIAYLQELNDSLLERLSIFLGLKEKDSLYVVDFDLSKAINLTISSFPLVEKEIKRRENPDTESIDRDILLLYSCGDNSKKLRNVADFSMPIKEKIFV